MVRPSLLNLSEVDRRQLLAEAAKSTDPDFRDSSPTDVNGSRRRSRLEVAAQFDVHPATVGRWATHFRRRGVDGLRAPERDRRGRPRKLHTQDLEWLRQTVLTPPPQLGYAFTNWTLPRLAWYLKQQRAVKVQPHYLGLLLRRMGLSRQRPKHVLRGKRDEQAHTQAKAELEQLKKNLSHEPRIIISQDETELHLFPYLVAIWCVVGSLQPQVPTPGKNQKRVLYGGLNLKTGRLTGHWAASKSGPHFIEYLERLLEAYPDQKVLMISDNGSFHHTKKVDAFLLAHQDRLEVKWLPPYCPDLNDIERTWRKLKSSHASNFLFNSLDDLMANVQQGIDELNQLAKQN